MQYLRDRLHRIAFIIIVQQVRQHFRIRLGDKLIALFRQHLPELDIILDDAVMHHRDRSFRVKMRMRIHITGHAVGGPSRVPDPADALHRLPVMGQVLQNLQSAHGFGDIDLLPVVDRHPRRIISTVLQPGQPVQNDRRRLFRSDIAHNSTHTLNPPVPETATHLP